MHLYQCNRFFDEYKTGSVITMSEEGFKFISFRHPSPVLLNLKLIVILALTIQKQGNKLKLNQIINHKHSNKMEKQQQKETRLDRIEKGIEMLLKGTSELKESQKKTDKQISDTDEQILDLKETQKRTEENLNKTIERLDRIGRQLADLGLVQGEVAEDLF